MSTMTLDALAERLDRLEKLLLAGAVEEVRTLNVTEVCRLTGLPRKAVLAAIRTEDLPSIEFGGDRVHLPWQEGAPRCVRQRRGEGINQ